MNELLILFSLFAFNMLGQTSVEYKVTENWTKWKYGEKLEKSEREGRTRSIEKVEIIENDNGKLVFIGGENSVDSFLVTDKQILKYSKRNNGLIIGIGESDVLSVRHLVVKTLYPKREFVLIRTNVFETNESVYLKGNFEKCLSILSDSKIGGLFEFDFKVESCGEVETIIPDQIWIDFKYSQTTSAGPGSHGIMKTVYMVKKT